MGPDFGLQRIRATSRGWEELQSRRPAADCRTRWKNDPLYSEPEERTISIVDDATFEADACSDSETS